MVTPERRSSPKIRTSHAPRVLWLFGSVITLVAALRAVSDTAFAELQGPGFFLSEEKSLWSLLFAFASLSISLLSSLSQNIKYPRLTIILEVIASGGFFWLVLSLSGSLNFIGSSQGPLQTVGTSPQELFEVGSALFASVGVVTLGKFFFQKSWKGSTLEILRGLSTGFFLLAIMSVVVASISPVGVNSAFAERAWPLLLGIGVILASFTCKLHYRRNESLALRILGLRNQPVVLLFVAIPLVPVLRYIVINGEYIGFVEGSTTLILALIASIIATAMIPVFLERLSPRVITMAFASGGLFFYLNMAAISASRRWFERGDFEFQILILLLGVAILLVLGRARLKASALVIGIFLLFDIGIPMVSWFGADSLDRFSQTEAFETKKLEVAASNDWQRNPDVYLLVYESYPNQETADHYGIDLSGQTQFLLDSGFEVHDGAYSLSATSVQSIGRVLDISEDRLSSQDYPTGGSSIVASSFSSKGYKTVGIFPNNGYFGKGPSTYDVSFPGPVEENLSGGFLSAISRGEFRFEDSSRSVDYDAYLSQKRRILSGSEGSPLFLHTHNVLPGHTQNTGECLDDELTPFRERMLAANLEMRADISSIENIDNAIVVIVGDHGPYLTKTCYAIEESTNVTRTDIQDRYGAFLAIRWPEGLGSSERIETTQNIFPSIFSVLTGSGAVFESLKVSSPTDGLMTGGVTVLEGVILGGPDHGEPLFLERGVRKSLELRSP